MMRVIVADMFNTVLAASLPPSVVFCLILTPRCTSSTPMSDTSMHVINTVRHAAIIGPAVVFRQEGAHRC